MGLFHRADGTLRTLAVIALIQLLTAVVVPLAWREPLRPGAIASMAVCVALIPLDEPDRRSRPWRQQLWSRYGLIAVTAVLAWLVVMMRILPLRH